MFLLVWIVFTLLVAGGAVCFLRYGSIGEQARHFLLFCTIGLAFMFLAVFIGLASLQLDRDVAVLLAIVVPALLMIAVVARIVIRVNADGDRSLGKD